MILERLVCVWNAAAETVLRGGAETNGEYFASVGEGREKSSVGLENRISFRILRAFGSGKDIRRFYGYEGNV